MIKATGITAEYNPLHNGHAYMIEKARSATSCDVVVAAMSGDFVQRGEPAILDKWTRCSVALESGADLVVEIPVQFCLGNATQYGSASVALLEAVGCSHIAFGSECGDTDLLLKTAEFIRSEKDAIMSRLPDLLKEGLSYPAAMSRVCKEIIDHSNKKYSDIVIDLPGRPNDILALEYIKNMKAAKPVCIKRQGAGYDDPLNSEYIFQSAGAIRETLWRGADTDSIRAYVPDASYKALTEGVMTFADDWTFLLKYAALRSSEDFAEDLPSAGEGLSNLVKSSAWKNDSWTDIVLGAKSKRYTYTRISRLCMQLILGVSRSRFSMKTPGYIRVLGFNEKGRELLADLRDRGCELPVITNINKEASSLSEDARRMLELDVFAADVYNLVTGRGNEWSDHVMKPVIK